MQSKSRIFRVTPRAYSDLLNIGRYTKNKWGISQRNNYLRELDNCFERLCLNAFLGIKRFEINEGYYSLQQGSHVVFYKISEKYIDIIGIPHKSMDIDNYFEDNI